MSRAARRIALGVKQLIFFLNDVSAALAYLARGRRPRPGLTVLCYHRVAEAIPRFPPFNPYNVHPSTLARQVAALRTLPGVTLVTTRDVASWITNGPPDSGSYLLVTFDDCWEHSIPAARQLSDAKVPATFFIATGFIGAPVFEFSSFDRWYAAQPNADPRVYTPITEAGCQALLDLGMEVQPHGDRHLSLGTVSPTEMKDDIDRSIRFVQARLGRDVIAFCYPFGSRHSGDYTPEVIDVLRRSPAVMAFSTDAGINPLSDLESRRYSLRRIPVNSYDRGILYAAKASGYSGALPILKAILHRVSRSSDRMASPTSSFSTHPA